MIDYSIRNLDNIIMGGVFHCRNSFNIYKQPMVCEVKKSFEVVSQLLRRIEVLLVEWPDHPTLMQVECVFFYIHYVVTAMILCVFYITRRL